jgi:hypothetical protein
MSFTSLVGLVLALYFTKGSVGTMTINEISLVLLCYFIIYQCVTFITELAVEISVEIEK